MYELNWKAKCEVLFASLTHNDIEENSVADTGEIGLPNLSSTFLCFCSTVATCKCHLINNSKLKSAKGIGQS